MVVLHQYDGGGGGWGRWGAWYCTIKGEILILALDKMLF